jgi:hypothetical protein
MTNQVNVGEHLGHSAGLSERLFLLQRVDEFQGRVEAHFAPVMLDGLDADGRCDVALARARPTDQDNILGVFHERATVQLPDGGFIDLAGFEVKVTCH